VVGELNLNTQAITIRDVMHKPMILSELTSLFIQKFTELIQSPEQLIIDNWINTVNIIGKKVRHLQSNAVYTVVSINKDGFLVCNTGTEDITIHFGDSIRYELF
jgi:biotin-(acetyl-CoA carboxylase) ligase